MRSRRPLIPPPTEREQTGDGRQAAPQRGTRLVDVRGPGERVAVPDRERVPEHLGPAGDGGRRQNLAVATGDDLDHLVEMERYEHAGDEELLIAEEVPADREGGI